MNILNESKKLFSQQRKTRKVYCATSGHTPDEISFENQYT